MTHEGAVPAHLGLGALSGSGSKVVTFHRRLRREETYAVAVSAS